MCRIKLLICTCMLTCQESLCEEESRYPEHTRWAMFKPILLKKRAVKSTGITVAFNFNLLKSLCPNFSEAKQCCIHKIFDRLTCRNLSLARRSFTQLPSGLREGQDFFFHSPGIFPLRMESATSSSSEDITTRPWMCGDQAPIKLLKSSHVTEHNTQDLLCTQYMELCVYQATFVEKEATKRNQKLN